MEAELAEARQQFISDLDTSNKQLAARETEIETLKKTLQEREGLVTANEKMDRELKHGKHKLNSHC